MKILMILDKPFPTDVRVENEALTLLKAGHSVGLLSIAPYTKNEIVDYKGIKVIRVAVSNFQSKKMHGLAAMIPWMDRFIAKKVKKIFRNEKYDAIHFHDLHLFGAARLIRKNTDAYLIGDMHENYVEVIKDYEWATKFPNRLIISHKKWARKEIEWLGDMDKLITVSQGIKDRIISKGVPQKDVLLVPNTISTTLFDGYAIDEIITERMQSSFNLIYVGGFVSNRGLEHVIEGMKELQKFADDIRLILVGDGDIRHKLEKLVDNNNLIEVVKFEGWHDQDKIKSYLSNAEVGLVPFKRTPQTDNSSSNKLFQYMYYELPILGTNCTSVKKLVEQENCGIIYESDNTETFIESVKKLYTDSELRKNLGSNGKKAVLEKYSWEITTGDMVEMYNSLEKV